jgi:hypothetical protein
MCVCVCVSVFDDRRMNIRARVMGFYGFLCLFPLHALPLGLLLTQTVGLVSNIKRSVRGQ